MRSNGCFSHLSTWVWTKLKTKEPISCYRMCLLVFSNLHVCCLDSSMLGLSLCTVPTYSTVRTIGLRCRRDYTIALSPACMMRSSTQVQNSKKNHTLALCRSRKWSGMKRLDVSLVLKLILRSFFYCNMFFKLWRFHLVSEEKKHLKTIKCKLCSVEIFSNWRHLLDLSEKQGTSIWGVATCSNWLFY